MKILVIGQSASGKSAYAENRAAALHKTCPGSLIYIATMKPYGEDAQMRIRRHHALRAGKGFETVGCYTDLLKLVTEDDAFRQNAGKGTVLLECMSNLMANEIFDPEGAGPEKAVNAITEAADELGKLAANLIIVTVNVFEDGVIYDPETEHYKKCLAEVNAALAVQADEVVEVVYSIPVIIKQENMKCSH